MYENFLCQNLQFIFISLKNAASVQLQSHTLAVMRLVAFQADGFTCIFHLYEKIFMPDTGRRHNVC